MRTPRESALLLALLYKRSGKTRARVSALTVKRLSKRQYLRTAFIEQLIIELDHFGIVLIELDRGGFGLISSSALNGAPTIKAKNYLMEDLNRLKKGKIDFNDILYEFNPELAEDTEEEF
ncbi:hypothetical protein [Endozoicomonas sp. SESOKO1]|uniref:hypothetical protein n=1 Tax=unclassified Endozoicomonas TaxID=2644528 RepID=UPI002147E709|nr:hypothetical protein [Endozoicomonas sp. SESOKO1]